MVKQKLIMLKSILRRITKDRCALSIAVALTLSGNIYKRHFEGSIKTEQLVEALEHSQRHIPEKIILIWDQTSIHLSKISIVNLHKHPELLVEKMPVYALVLNPEEYCDGNVKQDLKNARPASKEEVPSMLSRGFARLLCRPSFAP